MEKRMGRRFGTALARLLKPVLCVAAAVFFFAAFPVYSQEEADDVIVVQTTSSPANPVSGGSWILTVLIDHPVSQEVTVRPPRFPSALLLERVRTETRLIRPPAPPPPAEPAEGPAADEEIPAPAAAEPRRWTVVEFLFSLQAAGTVTIEPFNVSAKGKFGESGRVSVRIAQAPRAQQRNTPVFRWERPPASLVTGREAEIILTLQNWNPAKPTPRNLFGGRVPERFILEEQPFIGQEGSSTIRYPFRIIALEGENLVFGPLTLELEGETLEVPRVSIPVSAGPSSPRGSAGSLNPRAQGSAPETVAGAETISAAPAESEARIPFPDAARSVFPLFQGVYDETAAEAARLWNEGGRVRALAYIRAKERGSLAGPLYAKIRGEMEAKLGLSDTGDELWLLWRVLPWAAAAFSAVCVFIMKKDSILDRFTPVSQTEKVTKRSRKGFRSAVISVAGSAIIVLLVAGIFAATGPVRPGRSAVLEQTEAFRVPDSAGAVSARFGEGQPVTIRSSPLSWHFVESEDGRSGWIPSEKAINY